MKRSMILSILVVGLFLAINADAQIRPTDVVDDISSGYHPFYRARIVRQEAAARHGWGRNDYAYSDFDRNVPMPRTLYRQRNRRGGGFFDRGYRGGYYGGGYYDSNGRWWAPVAGQAAETVGNIWMNKTNNNTTRQVAGQQARLEEKRIDNEHELALRHETREDTKLRLQVERQSATPQISQGQPQVAEQVYGGTLQNRTSCEVKAFRGNQLAFVLMPNGAVPLDDYDLETEGCSIQTIEHGGDVLIIPGR
jgi:hypothetical protein